MVSRRLGDHGPARDGTPRTLPTNLTKAPASGLEGVAAVVLFYPYCGLGARAASHAWRLKAPVLFLLSGADTIVPTQACLAVARQLAAHGHTVTTHVYEGITHAFDRTDLPLERDLVYNAQATADARTRLHAFLAPLAVVDGTGTGVGDVVGDGPAGTSAPKVQVVTAPLG